MSPQIAPAGRALTGGAVHQMTRRCALAAVGAGFVAISISTYGADLGTRYSTALAVPSQRAPAGQGGDGSQAYLEIQRRGENGLDRGFLPHERRSGAREVACFRVPPQ